MPAQGTVQIKLHLNEGKWHWTETKTVRASTYKDQIDTDEIAEYWRSRTEQDAREKGRIGLTASIMSVMLVV